MAPVQLYRIVEVARVLGCGRTQVYELIAAGELRTVRMGVGGKGDLRVREDDLEAWIEKHTRRAAS